MDQLIGKTVAGKYVLVRLLGEGGMGQVYLGTERGTQRQVAVKLLREGLAEDPRFVSRMEREASAVRRVVHPNSVRLFDFGRDPLGVYLVMEYLSGESLWARLGKRGRLPPQEAVALLCQILAPLSLCHTAGVVHRDIKPDNIMLCPEGDKEVAKLLDFGIARLDKGPAVTRTGQILGTPAYMSPEQISGKGIGPASDIYAVGVLMYELLTGRLPFEAESQLELFRQHILEPAPSLASACPGEPWLVPFEPVVKKALAKSPKDRFSSVEEMSEALALVLSQAEQLTAFLPQEEAPCRAGREAEQTLALVAEYELTDSLEETWEEAPLALRNRTLHDDAPGGPTLVEELSSGASATLLLSETLSGSKGSAEDAQDVLSGCLDVEPGGKIGATLFMPSEGILGTLETRRLCALAEGESVCRESATEKMPALSPQRAAMPPVVEVAEYAISEPAARKAWWQALYLAPVWLLLWAFREARALLGRLLGARSSRLPSF